MFHKSVCRNIKIGLRFSLNWAVGWGGGEYISMNDQNKAMDQRDEGVNI